MKRVELNGRVRHAVMIEGLSQREAARCFGIDPRTVRKMLSYSAPPGYVRTRPPVRPKLDPFIGIIDRILEEDKDRPKKQRHTSKRIFERLRDEYGFTGKITIVKDYICGVRQRRREMFVPLTHRPGHAQVDFGEALAVIGGVERKIHFLAMSLPHSDACFVKAYPGETTEAFCDGHVSGFSFFGGVPRSILYDNTRIAVARILGDGKRQRTRVFSELRSHYLFEDRFGRPGKGNDKGKVEGIVGYCRRNFLAPMPRFRNFDDLNTHLEALRQAMGGTTAWPRPDGRRPPGTGSCGSSAPSRNRLRRLRQAPGAGQFAVAGALSRHRLLRPHTVRPLRGAGPRRCPRGGHQLRRRGDCQAPAFIRARGLRLRSAALSVLAGAKDQRAGSGGSLGRLAVAAGVRRSPPPT